MLVLRSQKGAALPVALMVLLVLSLLGTALWQYSTADAVQVARAENEMRAYYLARSGADATAAWMVNPVNDGGRLIGSTSAPKEFGGGTLVVDVYRNPDARSEIIIRSVATVNEVQVTAGLTLQEITGARPIFGSAVFVATSITLENEARVYGDVEIRPEGTVVIKNQGSITGQIFRIDRTPALPPFPDDLPRKGDVEVRNRTVVINAPGHYNEIEVEGNGELIFDTGTGGGDLRVRVGELEIKNQGRLTVRGNSRLLLYVDEFEGLNNSAINEAGDPSRLIMFVSRDVELKNATCFYGAIYAPGVDMEMKNTASINGAVVAKSIELKNKARLTYGEIDETGLPITEDGPLVTGYQRGYWQ